MSDTIFDHEADDLTHEFWGDDGDWVTTSRRGNERTGRTGQMSALQVRPDDGSGEAFHLDHTPTSMRAIREGIAAFRPKRRWRDDSTGPVERTREHHIVGERVDDTPEVAPRPIHRRPSPDVLPHRDATIAELAAGAYDDHVDHATDDRRVVAASTMSEPSAGLGDTRLIPLAGRSTTGLGLDPLVIRVLLVLLVVLLAIPLALALRDDSPSALGTSTAAIVPAAPEAAPEPAAAPDPADEPTSVTADAAAGDAPVESNDALTTASPAPATAAVDTATATPDDEPSVGATESAAPAAAPATEEPAPAAVEEPAERLVPDCSLTYTAGAGDSWYRIAGEAGVTPSKLLYQNSATTETVILPGDEICLPPGATVPAQPTTTTAAPTTTAGPTTTAAPTTTVAPARVAPASTDEVQAMIREIFPADQVDKALDVAWRESRYRADADNGWCCVGVFQIYWTVHRSWLDDYGIYTRDDLKDARKNITAAYALYQRSGGWSPWSTA